MATLPTKIKLYCEANGKEAKFDPDIGNVHIYNDGDGDYIKSWNVDGLDEPTDSQLENYDIDGNAVEANTIIDQTRRLQYGSWQDQMEMIYKDQLNGTTTFKDHCDKVRNDNPKE